MRVRAYSRSHRVKGSVNLKCGLVLCGCLLAALLLSPPLFRVRSEPPLDTQGWKLTDFLDHLQKRGVQAHVVWGARSGGLRDYLYLTEDPGASWLSLQRKPRTVEGIHQWHATVWVGCVMPGEDVEDALAQWGPYGCRIGDFLLFGDDRVLQRIQKASRKQGGR